MPEHRIFIKIYLWFWLATFIIVLSQITIDRVTQSDQMVNHMRHPIGNALSLYGQTAAEVYEDKGVSSFHSFVDHIDNSNGIQIFLFDDTGHEVAGHTGGTEISNLVNLAEKSGRTELIITGINDLGAQRFSSRSGKTYVVAGEFPKPPRRGDFGKPPRGGDFGKPPPLLVRLCVFVIVSGGICYWLAHYFSAPIIKLENAVRQFAGGNLSVRVSSTIGKRNDEISGLAQAFDRMAGRIESLLTSQRNLLRDVSHELRSPLARLNVALELSRQKCDPETGKTLDRIAREADKLNELIEQILTLNLFESGISAIGMTIVDIEKLIREITDDADFEAQSRNRGVKVVVSEACTILGNEELLRRAVENIVRNAVLYTIEDSTVEVSLINDKNGHNKSVSITVRDYGHGVPENEIEHIFKPFYRVGEDRDRESGGAGIGLAIAEAAVRFHGGTVKASNAPGGGLLIEVTIPAA
ncbi:HAMP domain-containing protein [bacterium]|nr:HAMP domain-containing protein [bacterium]